MTIPFVPTCDVVAIIHILLDVFERRGSAPRQAVRVDLDDVAVTLPGYFSQADPVPRVTANEQMDALEQRGLVRLTWQAGQKGHLLQAVTLEPERVERLYALVARESLDRRRERLCTLLLGDRSRFDGWRRRAVNRCLDQLETGKSPAPFNLDDDGWNRDLLAALLALPANMPGMKVTEIPYRVFSVRVFNDSKRFDALKGSVARLARQHNPEWRDLSNQETLCELGLVTNPDHLYLYGPWQLVDEQGQVVSLAEFHPSVGIPTALAGRVKRVRVDAARVVCVENLTSFYELIRHKGKSLAALCLWGNPSPASRHLLRCLANELLSEVPLFLWADIDYGGLSILSQLRAQISPRIEPYRMDSDTLDAHIQWAHPLSAVDKRSLARLKRQSLLSDMASLIDYMLLRDVKLEQEAVVFE
ncbi:MAG: Wadjet anti-phage system protein JetD domain-containing protein [Anaerolineae bacterium]